VRYRFGEFELDAGRFVLLRRGQPVRIEPKPLELLALLLERHPDTVSKDDLLDALWPDTAVTEGSLTRAVGEVRRALRERAESSGVIRTVRGRGYGIGVDVERLEGAAPGQEEALSPSPSTEVSATPERRLAAILHADAVGYSRLMAEDEAGTVERIRAYWEVMRACIRDRRGRVINTAGDAILAEFPTALEAVEAAVAIQRELSRRNAELPADRVMPFRIGLHLGDVRVEGEDLYGDGVNVAARLQALATPGGLALSGPVYSQVARKLDLPYDDLGEKRVKNIVEPVRVYQVAPDATASKAAKPAAPPKVAAPAPASDFVGRAAELAEASEVLAQVLAGRGHVLLISGEPGIGKTRLAKEIAERARRQGVEVLWGRCYEGEGRPAFWPWVQIVRGYLSVRSQGELRDQIGRGGVDMAGLIPEVRERLPDLPEAPRLAHEDARFRLFDSLTALFKAAALVRPLVVILDDLHWADDPSLRLLEFLTPEMGASRLLLLGTYRESEARHGSLLGRTLAELARTPHAKHVISLGGLSSDEAAALLAGLLGTGLPADLVAGIYERTEGNPLFLRELSQWIATDEGAGALGHTRRALPVTVRQVIGQRLVGLSEACHRLLSVASVIGRDFSLSLLTQAAEESLEEALDRLDEAEEAGIVAEAPGNPGLFRFTHALIRESLYEDLRTARRAGLHRRVGEALEGITADGPKRPYAELAHHFAEAAVGGKAAKAVEYCTLAGERATREIAFEEAVLQHRRALDLYRRASSQENGELAQLELRLAQALEQAGEATLARETLWQASDHARTGNVPECAAEIALEISFIAGVDSAVGRKLAPLLEEALDGLPECDSSLRVKLLGALAISHWRDDRRESLVLQAFDMARRLGDPNTLLDTMWVRLELLRAPHQDDERRALIEESNQLAAELNDINELTPALLRDRGLEFGHGLNLALELAEPDTIDREIAELERLANEIRTSRLLWWVDFLDGVRCLWQGRIAAAEAKLRASLEKGQRENASTANAFFGAAFYVVRRFQGRLGEVEGVIRDGASGEFQSSRFSCHFAALLAELDRDDDAREQLSTVLERPLTDLGRETPSIVYDLALLAETCAHVGDDARGHLLYDLLLPYAGRYVTLRSISTLGCASRYLGLLATVMGSYEDAEEHFLEALRVEDRMRALPWQAYALADYAHLRIRRAAPGDVPAARDQLDQALAIAREIEAMGIENHIRRVKQLL
jgi:class 3 adenylate cyclase/tetratricopeptide (TPR) repeat protein